MLVTICLAHPTTWAGDTEKPATSEVPAWHVPSGGNRPPTWLDRWRPGTDRAPLSKREPPSRPSLFRTLFGRGQPEDAPLGPDQAARAKQTLTASEVLERFETYVVGVRDCYVRHGAPQRTAEGTLQVEMIIKPSGELLRVTVTAPGIVGDRLGACVRQQSNEWRFPVREGYTTAVVPFNFVMTHAPGADPARRRSTP
jgi:hypothetical protein